MRPSLRPVTKSIALDGRAFRIAAGVFAPPVLHEEDIAYPVAAGTACAAMGIGRKFQKPTVFEQLTVFENLELALKTNKGVKASMFFKLDSAQSDRLAEVLHTIHLAEQVRTLAGVLSHGQKQWLEIGMLLMQDPKLLLLDEPVAGMTDHETERTAELFLTLKGKHSLMVVEHDMSFIRTISEIVTVLCDGSVLAQGSLDEVQADERVIEVLRRSDPRCVQSPARVERKLRKALLHGARVRRSRQTRDDRRSIADAGKIPTFQIKGTP